MQAQSRRLFWSIPVALLALTVWSVAVLPKPSPVLPLAVFSVTGLVSFVWLACHPWLRRFHFPSWLSWVVFACSELSLLLFAPAHLLGVQNLVFVGSMALLAFASAKRQRRPHART